MSKVTRQTRLSTWVTWVAATSRIVIIASLCLSSAFQCTNTIVELEDVQVKFFDLLQGDISHVENTGGFVFNACQAEVLLGILPQFVDRHKIGVAISTWLHGILLDLAGVELLEHVVRVGVCN